LGDLKARTIFVFAEKMFFDPKSGNSKFSQSYVVGTLNLYLKRPGTMQKKSDQSDHPVLRKRQKHSVLMEYLTSAKTAKLDHILDIFSGQVDRIEPIPFTLCQASQDTSLEYQQHIIPRTLNFHFLGG
jgi:hypothetical protein